jgi:hypothetical protein
MAQKELEDLSQEQAYFPTLYKLLNVRYGSASLRGLKAGLEGIRALGLLFSD